MAKAKKVFRYWVTGPGQFPDDMLRYNQAKVVRAVDRERGGRTFYLIEGAVAPTVGRWRSFLWVCIETAEQRERFSLPAE